MAVTGSTWLLRVLRGCYRFYMAVTGSTWLLRVLRGCYKFYMAVTGSTWLLRVLRGCYRVLRVAVTGSIWLLQVPRGCYGFYVAVTGSMWLLQVLRGCYRFYVGNVAVTGSTWLLRVLHGCYGIYVPHFFFFQENRLALIRDKFSWKCDRAWHELTAQLVPGYYLSKEADKSLGRHPDVSTRRYVPTDTFRRRLSITGSSYLQSSPPCSSVASFMVWGGGAKSSNVLTGKKKTESRTCNLETYICRTQYTTSA